MLAKQSLHELGVVVAGVIDARNFDTFGHLVGAVGTCDGRHDMFAGLDKLIDEVFSNCAAGLELILLAMETACEQAADIPRQSRPSRCGWQSPQSGP